MRYYIVAGEHSGDILGADLITQIKSIDSCADFWACGGQAMQKAMDKSCALYMTEMAYMGIDFFKSIYKIWKYLEICKKSLLTYRPHAVILIDYSGFNMRLAAFAKQNGFRIFYYIPPKIWAHGKQRIKNIIRDIDHIFSILPFETNYYQKTGYQDITYVGNPLVQRVREHPIDPTFTNIHGLDHRPIIALLPGSRVDEIRRILPIIVTQAAYFTSHQFIVAGLSHLPKILYDKIVPPFIQIVYDQTYNLLAAAQAAIVTSGSATLEVALWNVPQIVVYKTGRLSYCLAKAILTIPYISLVNLLTGQKAVPEIIQYQLTKKNLSIALTQLLKAETAHQQRVSYKVIRELLGSQAAAAKTAECILSILNHA